MVQELHYQNGYRQQRWNIVVDVIAEIFSLNLRSQYIHKFYVTVENAVIFQVANPMPQLWFQKIVYDNKGKPKRFTRSDLSEQRIRYFCGNCGTHICVKSPPRPGMLVLKIGTLDDHSWFRPQSAIYCMDRQPFHQIPKGLPSFEKSPPRKIGYH